MSTKSSQEHNFFIELKFDHEVNRQWLENVALAVEEAIDERLHDKVPSPSVTGNWANRCFEFDMIVLAENMGEAQAVIGEAMSIFSEVSGCELGADPSDDAPSEFRSTLRGEAQGSHESAICVPA